MARGTTAWPLTKLVPRCRVLLSEPAGHAQRGSHSAVHATHASEPAGPGRAGCREQPRQQAEAGGGACAALGRCRGGAGALCWRGRRDALGGQLHGWLLLWRHDATGRAIQGGESPLQSCQLTLLQVQRTQRRLLFVSTPSFLTMMLSLAV